MEDQVDGCIPSDRATGTSEEIEEERRLLYVAMTRAKESRHVRRGFLQQYRADGKDAESFFAAL